jgi:hypothetical protein
MFSVHTSSILHVALVGAGSSRPEFYWGVSFPVTFLVQLLLLWTILGVKKNVFSPKNTPRPILPKEKV